LKYSLALGDETRFTKTQDFAAARKLAHLVKNELPYYPKQIPSTRNN